MLSYEEAVKELQRYAQGGWQWTPEGVLDAINYRQLVKDYEEACEELARLDELMPRPLTSVHERSAGAGNKEN